MKDVGEKVYEKSWKEEKEEGFFCNYVLIKHIFEKATNLNLFKTKIDDRWWMNTYMIDSDWKITRW